MVEVVAHIVLTRNCSASVASSSALWPHGHLLLVDLNDRNRILDWSAIALVAEAVLSLFQGTIYQNKKLAGTGGFIADCRRAQGYPPYS